MSGVLSKDRLVLDTTSLSSSDNVGAYLIDSAGNLITSQANGSQQALDVGINVAGVQIDPRDIRALTASDVVSSNTRDGAGTAITSTLNGGKQSLDVNLTNALDVNVELNGIYNVSTNPLPDNVGMIAFTRAATPALTDQIQTVTSATAASDAVVAANVHGLDVNSFLMGYNGTTWDRLHSTSGALNVALTTASTMQVVGNIADDGVDSGNPVKVGSRAVFGVLPAISTTGDRADLVSDRFRRLWVNDSADIGVLNTNVTVGLTAAKLLAAELTGRKTIMIQNLSNKAIFIGNDNTVTSVTGFEIAAGGTMSIDIGGNVSIWGISGTAARDVRIFEAA